MTLMLHVALRWMRWVGTRHLRRSSRARTGPVEELGVPVALVGQPEVLGRSRATSR